MKKKNAIMIAAGTIRDNYIYRLFLARTKKTDDFRDLYTAGPVYGFHGRASWARNL